MDKTRRHQVSLRGASAKEITRDALLEKVSLERELRNFTRRATSAAHFIQRVWRRYSATKKIALHFQQEWEIMIKCGVVSITRSWISTDFLRPFLFFITRLSTRKQRFQERDVDCMLNCFRVLLDSINSTDAQKNFCALATCTIEEKKTWNYQAKKLISLSLLILSECDYSPDKNQDLIILSSLAMRFVVILIDVKMWKIVTDKTLQDSDIAVMDLVQYMGGKKSGLYVCVRKYISRLDAPFTSQVNNSTRTDDKFLITASAVTLALRPFRIANLGLDVKDNNDPVHDAAEQYCVFLLTIPWFAQRLPGMILSALKHESVLSPCFRTLLVSKETIMKKISELYNSNTSISQVGWTLANIIYLSTETDSNNSLDLGKFTQGLDYSLYLRVVNILAENLVSSFQKFGTVEENETHGSLKMSYMDFYKPLCQQGHLMKLLTFEKQYELLDVAYYYSRILKIYSVLNPTVGSLPVLNLLSFTPRFLLNLWESLVKSIFNGKLQIEEDELNKLSERKKDKVLEMKQKQVVKDTSSRWTNVLNKITGNSKADLDKTDSVKYTILQGEIDEDSSEMWDIDPMRRGPDGISKDSSCLLNLFCATYSHLLLVLDDIEFYDKQVPFKLAQQRRTASMLNTLVCNGLCYGVGEQHRSLMDSAIRCLHLLYERDCRHQFCPPELWLSPARKNRPPIAVAARTHEAMSSAVRSDDSSSMRSVITTIPHVFPFEERVQMFREFINMDKVSRRMAGEVVGPGPQAIEVVIRRNHIVEDGFEQLNSLGSRLKSGIHVSFVSECGLPEAGLDYGGLSKEFLTDIAKAAFTPEYGLFSQTSTTERLIMPNTSARFLENGIQMIEFLGRIVGKALYEGILLNYSFSHAFVQKLLGRYSFLDELSTLDPELYKSLMCVKHYDGDVMDLSLDFTVTEESFGKMHIVELIPGGKDVSVNNENKLLYLHAMADYKLNRQVLPFSNAFYRGLTDLVSPSWLKLFNASEFNQLLSGGNHDIDVDDLRNNTRYTGGYSEGSRTIKLFWEVISGFEPNERCLLLKFVTSCSRAPLLGFKHLQPTFTIHKVVCDVPLWAAFGGQDVERLPSAGTCYNTLKLPSYKRSSTLRAKLLYAINSNAGFELS